jgi:hypothetical protein
MKQRASVLVAVLWCVALLSVVVVGSLYTTRLNLGAAKNFEDKVQAHYLALAGVEKAKALIFHDALARQKSAQNHSGELFSRAEALRNMALGRGVFRVIRQGAPEEGDQVVYGWRTCGRKSRRRLWIGAMPIIRRNRAALSAIIIRR